MVDTSMGALQRIDPAILGRWDEEPGLVAEALLREVVDYRLTRRQLLAAGLWGGLALVLSACTRTVLDELLTQIANRPVRRSIGAMALSDPVVVAYQSAVQKMRDLDGSDPSNPLAWTNQARIHQNFCPHGNWLFLPWHRAYLFQFERICRKLSGMSDFALPYWNWSLDRSIPAAFWNGDALSESSRIATATSQVPTSVFAPAALEPILFEPNFLNFASGQITSSASQRQSAGYGPLEGGPHNVLHGFVGGIMGSFMSPLDPVFWTHHNMVEACWVDWNIRRGHSNTNDSAWTQRQFTEFFDENGAPVTVRVIDTILYPLLSYRFDIPNLGTT
jgi:tyrosinase